MNGPPHLQLQHSLPSRRNSRAHFSSLFQQRVIGQRPEEADSENHRQKVHVNDTRLGCKVMDGVEERVALDEETIGSVEDSLRKRGDGIANNAALNTAHVAHDSPHTLQDSALFRRKGARRENNKDLGHHVSTLHCLRKRILQQSRDLFQERGIVIIESRHARCLSRQGPSTSKVR